ncbi:MAG: MBL fold metallo-hydrolase [Lachnospiraceae bacterium]|nr:MBL fold metallo-hydrolase [Lachnospiraceae bacterium]
MSKIYNKICFFIFLIIIFLFSCNIYSKKNNLSNNSVIIESEVNIRSTLEYKYYDVLNISPAKIIIPKNQTVAQSLSVLVNDGHGNLVVFDGGRVEDADYLCDIIKDNGGVVKTWFITHIHDDHIGALYKILSDKRTDI